MSKKIRSILAYIWAVLCLVIVFLIFADANLPRLFVKATSVKIDPYYSGGTICYDLPSDTLDIKIHEPVFPALIGESKIGFVQMDFYPAHQASGTPSAPETAGSTTPSTASSTTPATASDTTSVTAGNTTPATAGNTTPATATNALPSHITAPIDFNQDGTLDFILEIDTQTGKTALNVCPSKQMTLGVSTKVHDHWMVRVSLPNPRKAGTCAPSACAACPAFPAGSANPSDSVNPSGSANPSDSAKSR